MAVCLQLQWLDIQYGIAMPGSERPLILQLEQQIENVIFLVDLTEPSLNGRLFIGVITNREI